MSKQYTWQSVSKRLEYEGMKLAERNSKKSTGGNCHILSVSIVIGCDGRPMGLIHPEIQKMEPIGEDWVIESDICDDI